MDRLWHLVRLHVPLWGWESVAILVALLVIASAAAVLLWPRSRRWSLQNRLHRVATHNEAGVRRDTRDQLDGALRSLGRARRDRLRAGSEDDVQQITLLIKQIETARDQAACDYVPSPANARTRRRELDLDQLLASEVLGERCQALAVQVRKGQTIFPEQLNEAREALERVNERGVALP